MNKQIFIARAALILAVFLVVPAFVAADIVWEFDDETEAIADVFYDTNGLGGGPSLAVQSTLAANGTNALQLNGGTSTPQTNFDGSRNFSGNYSTGANYTLSFWFYDKRLVINDEKVMGFYSDYVDGGTTESYAAFDERSRTGVPGDVQGACALGSELSGGPHLQLFTGFSTNVDISSAVPSNRWVLISIVTDGNICNLYANQTLITAQTVSSPQGTLYGIGASNWEKNDDWTIDTLQICDGSHPEGCYDQGVPPNVAPNVTTPVNVSVIHSYEDANFTTTYTDEGNNTGNVTFYFEVSDVLVHTEVVRNVENNTLVSAVLKSGNFTAFDNITVTVEPSDADIGINKSATFDVTPVLPTIDDATLTTVDGDITVNSGTFNYTFNKVITKYAISTTNVTQVTSAKVHFVDREGTVLVNNQSMTNFEYSTSTQLDYVGTGTLTFFIESDQGNVTKSYGVSVLQYLAETINGLYGYDYRTLPSEAAIAGNETYGWLYQGLLVNHSSFDTDWPVLLDRMNFSREEYNTKTFFTLYYKGDLSENGQIWNDSCTYSQNNISALTGDTYFDQVGFIIIEANGTIDVTSDYADATFLSSFDDDYTTGTTTTDVFADQVGYLKESPVTGVTGPAGEAFTFNGTNWVEFADDSSMRPASDFAVHVRFKVDPSLYAETNQRVIAAKNNGWAITLIPNESGGGNSQITFYYGNSANQLSATVTGGIPFDSWEDWTFTYNSTLNYTGPDPAGLLVIQRNGTVVNLNVESTSLVLDTNSGNLSLGGQAPGGFDGLVGELDQVTIFDRYIRPKSGNVNTLPLSTGNFFDESGTWYQPIETDWVNFTNHVAQCVLEDTNTRYSIFSKYNSSGLDNAFVNYWTMPQITGASYRDILTAEKGVLSAQTTLNRVYRGLTEALKANVKGFQDGVYANLRSNPNGSAVDGAMSMQNGDVVIINDAASSNVFNINLGGDKDVWDQTNKELLSRDSADFSTTVGADSYAVIYVEYLDHFTLQNLYKGVVNQNLNYQTYTGLGTAGTFSVVGANEVRMVLWDPTYIIPDHLEFHTYEVLNYSYVTNFSNYGLLTFSKGTPTSVTPAELNTTFDVTNNPGILDKTFGYISVADYTNNQSWVEAKKVEADEYIDDYGVNIFLDGLDTGVGSENFTTRLKAVTDYVRYVRGGLVILNDYTAYQEVSAYGDYDMKESFCGRWEGTVGSPTYLYENLTIDRARAIWARTSGHPQIAMSFGDRDDYDKQAFCYAMFLVLYGTENVEGDTNYFRYAQPNFQTQMEIRVPDVGSQLENIWTEVNSTYWYRTYANGRVWIDPVSKLWGFENGRTVNDQQLCIHLQHYIATPSVAVPILFDLNEGTDYNITWDEVGSTQWSDNWVCKDVSASFTPAGRYDVRVWSSVRGSTNGMNIFNEEFPRRNVQSAFDNSLDNYPAVDPAWVWYGRSGDGNDLNTTNWQISMNLSDSVSAVVDDVDSISQSYYETTYTTEYNVTSPKNYNLSVWGEPITLNYNNITTIRYSGSETLLNFTNTSNCLEEIPTWTDSVIDGETHGTCVQIMGPVSYVRIKAPRLSTQTYEINATQNTAPVAENVTLGPAVAYTTTTLYGAYNWTDIDVGQVDSGSTYQWFVDDVEIPNQNTTHLTGGNFSKGETVIFMVTPSDGKLYGTPVNSSGVTILNTPVSVAINTPSLGGSEFATVNISYSASDADGDAFLTNLTISNTTNTTPLLVNVPYTTNLTTIDSTTYNNGPYNVTVTSCDDTNCTTDEIFFYVRNVDAPVLSALYASPNVTATNLDVNLSGVCSAYSDHFVTLTVVSINVTVEDPDANFTYARLTDGYWIFNETDTVGDYTATFNCTDSDGQSVQDSIVFSVDATEVDSEACPAVSYPNEENLPTAAKVVVNFSVYAPNGFSGDSVNEVSLSDGVNDATVFSCAESVVDSYNKDYTCNVTLNYWYSAGDYDLTVNVTTEVGREAYSESAGLCTVGELLASRRTVDTITFPTAGPGINNAQGTPALTVLNTGNVPFNISIRSYDLEGRTDSAEELLASNFKAGNALGNATTMADSVLKSLGYGLIPGNGASNSVTFWLSMPISNSNQEYYTPTAWQLVTSG